MKNNNANSSGQNSEAVVECILSILKSKGYPVTSQYIFNHNELRGIPIASKTIRVDFLVRNITDQEAGLIIEIKRQNSPGSADQKLVYQIEKEIMLYYPYPAILVMIGEHWSNKWKFYALSNKGKWLIDVFFSYESLQMWCEALPKAKENIKSLYGMGTYNQPPLI